MLNTQSLKFSSLVSLLAAGALLSVACGSEPGGDAAVSAGAGSSAVGGAASFGGGGATATAGSEAAVMEVPKPGVVSPESAGVLPLQRLTHREYSNTMAALLSDTSKPGSEFAPDGPGPSGFEAPRTVATENARSYMETAETLAAAALTAKSLVIPCSAPADAAAEAACVTSLVKDFGAKAYRRDLIQSEVDDLVKLFQTVKGLGATFQESVTAAVEAILQSPNLLYHWEIGDKPALQSVGPATPRVSHSTRRWTHSSASGVTLP